MITLKEKIEIGDPFFVRNLLIFPFYPKNGKTLNFLTLDEIMEKGDADIKELNGGIVDRVFFINKSNQRVLGIDGDALIGAYQDRVVNTAFFAEKKSEFILPVTCVEKGRWGGKETLFKKGGASSYPSLRALLCYSTTRSLRSSKKFQSDQDLIWQSIEQTILTLRVHSKTQSMSDVFSTIYDDLERFIEGVNLDNCVGMATFVGQNFLCMDYFISKEVFKKYYKKLIKGYAIDAFLNQKYETPVRSKDIVIEILNKISKGKKDIFPSVSLGQEVRINTRDIIFRGLKYRDDFLHIAGFSKKNSKE